jgi:hypothetical protein
VLSVDEDQVLDMAAGAYATMLRRAGLAERFPILGRFPILDGKGASR